MLNLIRLTHKTGAACSDTHNTSTHKPDLRAKTSWRDYTVRAKIESNSGSERVLGDAEEPEYLVDGAEDIGGGLEVRGGGVDLRLEGLEAGVG